MGRIKDILLNLHRSVRGSLGAAVGKVSGEVVEGSGTAGKEFDVTIAIEEFSKALKYAKEAFDRLKAGDVTAVMISSEEKLGIVMPIGEEYFVGLAGLRDIDLKKAIFELKIAQNRIADELYG
ncbi:MAG: roadblock/LC7 domain-containing protein [Candidatus Syntropharchaeia archaeon]